MHFPVKMSGRWPSPQIRSGRRHTTRIPRSISSTLLPATKGDCIATNSVDEQEVSSQTSSTVVALEARQDT